MKRFKSCEKTALSKASVNQGLQHLESWGFPQADSTGMLCYSSLNFVIKVVDRQTMAICLRCYSRRDLQGTAVRPSEGKYNLAVPVVQAEWKTC